MFMGFNSCKEKFGIAYIITTIIIQQIVTLSKCGHDSLNICHMMVTDILRYT